MPFKEVKELRKTGKLDEALAMAQQDLEQNPDDIWNKRSIAWVYYEFLKKYASPEDFEQFKEFLENIKGLELPEDEKMVFDTSAFQVGKLVFSFQNNESIDYSKVNEIFELIKGFHFTKPSEAYSFLYKAFHKGYKNWSKYLDFADWWDFENFRSEDYLPEQFNERKSMAIAEQAYIAYAKKLLEGEAVDQFGLQRKVDKERIQVFEPKLDTLIDKHPEYQYPPYFKAKLLLALGDNENVLSAFLSFAKKKRNDFWVWELMAEIFSEDKKIQFACYCKALSLKTPEDFLVKLRQVFAGMLVDRQMYGEAKTEIQQVIATREKHEWRLPNQIIQWIEQDWYQSATAHRDNKELYSKHVREAEEILFQDIPEEIVAVEFVNRTKDILNFVKDKHKHGFFKYTNLLDKPEIGDVLKVRFKGDGKEGYYKVLTAKKVTGKVDSTAIRNFKGNLRLIAPNNFGFADDVFIDPKTVEENKLQNAQEIQGKAILTFNKKKNEWGWKAIALY